MTGPTIKEVVLITGANGFVGLNLAEALLDRGCEVVLYDRRPSPAALAGRAHEVIADVADLAALDAAIGDHGATRLVHAAAPTSGAEREMQMPEAVLDVNVRAALSLARLGHRHGCRGFLLVSSAAVYADRPGRTVLDEETPTRPDTLYGATKAAAEQALRILCARYALPFVVGRLPWVFGPHEQASGVRDTLSPIHQLTGIARAGGVAVFPRPDRRNWIYSRDAAAALARLLFAERPGHDLYCLGPGTFDLEEWCALLVGRYREFSYSIGADASGTRVELHTDGDGPPMSGARYEAEFGPVRGHGLTAAFEDYMAWLDREAHGPATSAESVPKEIS